MPRTNPQFSKGETVIYIGPDEEYTGTECTIIKTGKGTEFGSPAYDVEFDDGEHMSSVGELHLKEQ